MKTYRPVLSALALISVFALTGAKGEGCGGTAEPEPEPGPCGEAAHLETVCLMECYESSEGEGGCFETCEATCVPDDDCPPGTFPIEICDEPLSSSGDSAGAPCLADDCAEPPPEYCRFECLPVDPCGPGLHQETVCEPSVSAPSGSGDEPAPLPEECYEICVPDDECPPGSHVIEVCTETESGELDCWTECEQLSEPPDSAS
jgi:hypothetical protein